MRDRKSSQHEHSSKALFMPVVVLLFSLIPLSFISLNLIESCISNYKQSINDIKILPQSPTFLRLVITTALSVAVSLRSYRKKSLDVSGLVTAIVVGFCLTIANTGFFVTLLTFFLTSSRLTKFKSEVKRRIEHDFKYGGQRNWVQVLCNGGIASMFAVMYCLTVGYGTLPINFASNQYYNPSLLAVSVVASLACCAGDTWASEIGSAIGSKTPILITTLQPVPVGTNGALSIIGTMASAAGGFVVGLSYYISLYLMLSNKLWFDQPPQWPIVLYGTFAGFFGSMVDSYLGATVQYSGYRNNSSIIVHHPAPDVKHISGYNILDNHMVNFVSALVATIVTSYLAAKYWPVEL